ncbi:beta-ketoacyl-ACP synthase 3 [Fangia hongkongensis]|uniref:beta-ketoacyl-ACP synthase 3 n=1 Tax=Fangia hongkongensis TaxID=270495 RepID=UPI0003720D51|nr:beta-ketoacyl-ACP synthase 3 [Fangia hongkongensis]MBK2124912.1 beta-ketoacyl-ACP synthase 3 [Fangia hongkongensis]
MTSSNQKRLASLINCYRNMYRIRVIDNTESEMVNSGKANFLASSAGHEGAAIFAEHFTQEDWLHCHYRDKPLMHARGIKPVMFFYSSLCKAEGVSNGRQMVIGMSERALNIVSIITPVGNQALPATGIAHSIKNAPSKPIVYCGMGDGTTQQGEVLEAFAEAKRHNLPVLFVIQDNNQAISTRTKGKTFYSLPDGSEPTEFMGIPITHLDGTKPFESYDEVGEIIDTMRKDKAPQIIILKTVRLNSHSNADDHRIYRSADELETIKKEDPLIHARHYLLDQGVAESELSEIEKACEQEVSKAAELSLQGSTPEASFDAEKPLPSHLLPTASEYRGDFSAETRLGMGAAMREVFRHRLQSDDKVYLLGEDIEDEKGDVFGVTKGLSTQFPGRVVNSPLAEATIVGVCSGMALTGKRPVAFIQFADFMPPAYNQIFTELATMHWRSNGDWDCPVIVFAACGGYRPGLGPFHAQTNEGTYAHIPGLDVYMPSNAADAAGMLNAAFESNRPSIFLYPKKLLNNASVEETTSSDIDKQLVPVGKARIAKPGSDITLVGWGNTVSLCHEVSETLESVGIDAEIIDMRTIKPYDLQTVLSSAEKTKHLIVTHEDNMTCGLGGDIIASVVEHAKSTIKAKRVTRADTYVPCNFDNQMEVLPSFERLLGAAADMLDLTLEWEVIQNTDSGSYNVEVIGASPSDESVLITDLYVNVGDTVKVGDKLVDLEASKSVGEILSPSNGTVEEIYVEESERVTVGDNLLKLRLPEGASNVQKVKKRPILKRKVQKEQLDKARQKGGVYPVGIMTPSFKTGSKCVTNEMLLQNFPDHSSSDIIDRTGIEKRYWLDENENILDLTANVAIDALNKANLTLADIDQVICATSSPDQYLSPSMACLVLEKLYHSYGERAIPAYDINAACSGYIYALQNARDYLQTRPNKRVLVITSEYMSKRTDVTDFDTAFLFADAATATIVNGNDHQDQSCAVIDEISLTANAENGDILSIPTKEGEYIRLEGQKLFSFAVKTMSMIMHKCCQQSNIALNSVDLVIPHQANQRISNAVERRLKMQAGTLYSNIANYGNTSSCTIPIALGETLDAQKKDNTVALCAFGSGFTAAAALLTMLK